MTTIINSHKDADAVACQMAEQMVVGETWGLNALDITLVGDYRFTVANRPGLFWTVELAELVLWPERARVNDWLRTHKYNA